MDLRNLNAVYPIIDPFNDISRIFIFSYKYGIPRLSTKTRLGAASSSGELVDFLQL